MRYITLILLITLLWIPTTTQAQTTCDAFSLSGVIINPNSAQNFDIGFAAGDTFTVNVSLVDTNGAAKMAVAVEGNLAGTVDAPAAFVQEVTVDGVKTITIGNLPSSTSAIRVDASCNPAPIVIMETSAGCTTLSISNVRLEPGDAYVVDTSFEVGDQIYVAANLVDSAANIRVSMNDNLSDPIAVPASTNLTVPSAGAVTLRVRNTPDSSGAVLISLSCALGGGRGDLDRDGVIDAIDNCDRDVNPNQEDGWGSREGDACDPNYYDSGNGVVMFPHRDGTLHIYGNCIQDDCELIAVLRPANLVDAVRSDHPVPIVNDSGWSVVVYLLGAFHLDHDFVVFQINVYDANRSLMDDRVELFVHRRTKIFRWHIRGS